MDLFLKQPIIKSSKVSGIVVCGGKSIRMGKELIINALKMEEEDIQGFENFNSFAGIGGDYCIVF